MPLKFFCRSCGKPIIVAFMKKGEKTRCKYCQAETTVPEDAVETDEQPSYLAPLPEISGKREEAPPPVVESELGPRNLGKLIGDSFNIYSKNFSAVFFLYIVWNVALMALITAIGLMSSYSSKGIEPEGLKLSTFLIFLLVFVSIFVNVITTGSLIRAVCRQFQGKVDVDECFRNAFGKFWRLLGAGLLVQLGCGLMAVTIIGIPFAIYFGVNWIFVQEVVVIEDSKVINAFYRSKALVRGFKSSWWRVFGVSCVMNIIFGAMYIFIWLIPYAGVILAMFVLPFYIIAPVLLYLDLRVRKEGLTPALLAKDLGLSLGLEGQTATPVQ